MKDPRINFRTREIAAVLAFLIPGAGHYYQGRRVKAGIFFSGIVSLFFAGMVLGNWQPVYSQTASSSEPIAVEMLPKDIRPDTRFSIGYGAQVFSGVSALPALLQQTRFSSDPGIVRGLSGEMASDFVGVLRDAGRVVPVQGQILLKPADGGRVQGSLSVVTQDGTQVSAEFLSRGGIDLGRRVFGSPRRRVVLHQVSGISFEDFHPTQIVGSVSRSFLNWFQAPRDNGELDRLHGSLSHQFDIACVFTWIAGLLNLMAIWDAYDGPAYGYGDESPDEDADPDENDSNKSGE